MLAQPKPEKRARVKARNRREAAKIVRQVRAACVARDGYCRYGAERFRRRGWSGFDDCQGESQWAHLDYYRRFKTRGREPAYRHNTANSCMLCARHHQQYDERKLNYTCLSDLGADGPIAWERT
jgi:hypothetical protein